MENLLLSTVLDTDSYKLSHWKQYPPKTTAMYSYFESRGGYADETLFFGLQYYLKKYFTNPVLVEHVEEANEFAKLHGLPFNYEGWMYIAKDLKGKLPVVIKAVPEGSIIPTGNVLLSVESLDPKCFWVVSWFETILVRLWYPITVATNSWHIKQIIKDYLNKTSDTPDEVSFKLHDFGSRGSSSQESAMIGGASHLVNFMGSDTIAGIWMANKYYNEKMAGFSIPAAEHSTMTMWGKDNEVEAYRNMIKQYGDGNIFACVSDSYDIFKAADEIWGQLLKKEVMDCKATIVIRPDSGNPVAVIHELLDILDRRFGSTINAKGYRVLNKVRLIQGDGIDKNDVSNILGNMLIHGYSATNVAFGMGGGLLQKNLDRDTHKFAFKCSWAKVAGKDINVFKSPVTDKVKVSKAGKQDLRLITIDAAGQNRDFVYTTRHDEKNTDVNKSLLETVYVNGDIVKETSFAEVRNRSNNVPYVKYTGFRDQV